MSFREDSTEEGRADLCKPFMHTGCWYRMGSAGGHSSMLTSSMMVIKDSSISVVACVMIIALGPIQFGFTCGYSSPTQSALTNDLKLTTSEFSLFGSLSQALMLTNWLMAFLVTMSANLLLTWNKGGTFTMHSLFAAFTVVFVTLWFPETKGRTLEEIQQSFK